MTYCSNCGHAAADGARFCVNCGKPLTPSTAPNAAALESSSDAGAAQSSTGLTDSSTSPQTTAPKGASGGPLPGSSEASGKRRKWGYAVGVVVFWIVQGAVLLLVNAMNGPSDSNDVGSVVTKLAFAWFLGGAVTAFISKFAARAVAPDINNATLRKFSQ